MKARQVIGGASFPPDVLEIVFGAFDDAWSEVAPAIGDDQSAIEAGRMSLAIIVLSLADGGTPDRDSLKAAALNAFRLEHHLH